MQKTPDFYDFCGIRLFVADLHIEILESGKEYIPSPIHRSFLLVLLRKHPEAVAYEELWRDAWRSRGEMSGTDLRNIQTTKGQLALWFRDKIGGNLPVEAEAGIGYRLKCEVLPVWNQAAPGIETSGEQDKSGIRQKDIESGIGSDSEPVIFSVRPEAVVIAKSIEAENKYLGFGQRFPMKWKLFSASFFLLIIFVLMWRDSPSPRLEKAEFISMPVPGREFYLRLTGGNFDSETVRLRVVGPGCGGDDPCLVKNGELRLYGRITESAIEKVPVTLAAGEYQVWLEDESGNTSNKLTVSVPSNN